MHPVFVNSIHLSKEKPKSTQQDGSKKLYRNFHAKCQKKHMIQGRPEKRKNCTGHSLVKFPRPKSGARAKYIRPQPNLEHIRKLYHDKKTLLNEIQCSVPSNLIVKMSKVVGEPKSLLCIGQLFRQGVQIFLTPCEVIRYLLRYWILG